jgi:hypothetical protein
MGPPVEFRLALGIPVGGVSYGDGETNQRSGQCAHREHADGGSECPSAGPMWLARAKGFHSGV